ncbi:MAG: HAD family phosphatase [Galbitalea sp.]
MSISIPGRVVVFDYGEVLSQTPNETDRAEIIGIAGVDAEPFWASYWSHRDELDRGSLSVTEYWRRIESEVGANWSASELQRLWAADFRSWISVEPGAIELLAELYSGGTRLALLSNAGFDFGGALRASPMGQYFERVFVSAELDLLKPDPAIYRHVATELGITPAQFVFVDNKSVNTEAAAALGVTVHHFVGVDELARFLRSLGE